MVLKFLLESSDKIKANSSKNVLSMKQTNDLEKLLKKYIPTKQSKDPSEF